MAKNAFVFNDQNQKNSYGFKILTSGIGLKRFKKNPTMLNQHWNALEAVLGKWENIRVEKDLLLGEPVFDLDDPKASEISGKVERNFINSCSMGITFNREDLKIVGEELIMEKCELYEVSIVAVPSNANSIRLYADDGKLLNDNDVKELCLSLQPPTEIPSAQEETKELKINPETMKKIVLSIAVLTALGFDKNAPEQEVDEVEKKVLQLSNDLATANGKLLAIQTAKENEEAERLEKMLTLAMTQGKFVATKKAEFEALGKVSLSILESTLEAIPAKLELAVQTVIPAGTGATATTKEEFQKLSLEAKLAFKASNPAEYQKLFAKS